MLDLCLPSSCPCCSPRRKKRIGKKRSIILKCTFLQDFYFCRTWVHVCIAVCGTGSQLLAKHQLSAPSNPPLYPQWWCSIQWWIFLPMGTVKMCDMRQHEKMWLSSQPALVGWMEEQILVLPVLALWLTKVEGRRTCWSSSRITHQNRCQKLPHEEKKAKQATRQGKVFVQSIFC